MRARVIKWLTAATICVLVTAAPLRAQECDDSDPCTVNDMCGVDGLCHGTPQAGASCDDHNDCTNNDRCQPNGGCKGDPAEVGTSCSGGCGTCQQAVPVPGVPLTCSGNMADNGKACDPGFGKCLIGTCQIIGVGTFTEALCPVQIKQCPTSSGCKGFCNFQTGECDSTLSYCADVCERCNTATNSCEPANIGAPCDDFNVCTPESSCQILSQRGVCLSGTPSAPNPTPTATPPSGAPTATATVHVVGTATASPTPGGCVGDCNGRGVVGVSNLIILVNVALGTADASACSTGIPLGAQVNIGLIIQAVNNVLFGCPP